MLIWIGIVFVAAIALFLTIAAVRSPQFKIERSTVIAASPLAVFEEVNDIHRAQAWSPWVKKDPAMIQTFEGPPAGVGASQSWEGNRNIGAGRQTVIESRPGELVRFKLEFFRPFVATNTADFTFSPRGDQTLVTWSMIGTNNFVCRVMSMLISIDKMVGKDFEQGLQNLKAIAEAKR